MTGQKELCCFSGDKIVKFTHYKLNSQVSLWLDRNRFLFLPIFLKCCKEFKESERRIARAVL